MKENTEHTNNLKQVGLKVTKQRVAILDILDSTEEPLTAEEIFTNLLGQDISINISTVYRILETFTEKKLTIKLNIVGNNKTLYELNKMAHKHYLVCTECKKIKTINYCPLGSYEKILEDETDFLISGHKLAIYGVCPKCQEKLEKKTSK